MCGSGAVFTRVILSFVVSVGKLGAGDQVKERAELFNAELTKHEMVKAP
jgi:hypothetical protein